MEVIINESDLKDNEIDEIKTKVRALLIDENYNILIAYYHDVILLPGGKVGKDEDILKAIIRELFEEIGQVYTEEELDYLGVLNYYQKAYPKKNGEYSNRIVRTYYYIGNYKGINSNNQKLSENEMKSDFRLELVPLKQLENIVLNNKNDNFRNKYYQKEMVEILSAYNKVQ